MSLYLILVCILGGAAASVVLLAVVGKVPLKYNVRNLVVRWRTTLLAALAFTLVVALMTVMLAFVNGMYRLTDASGQPGNVVVMSEGSTDEAFSNLGFGDIKMLNQYRAVEKDEKGQPLVSWEVFAIANQPIPNAKPGGRKRRFLQLRGVEDAPRSGRVHNLDLHPGGAWFAGGAVQELPSGEKANQVVVGEGIARDLGHDFDKPTLVPGDVIDVAGRKWYVVGILRSAGSTFDSEVWAKETAIYDSFGKKSFTTAVFRSANLETAQEAAKDLSNNFKPAVLAQAERDYYEKLNGTNKQFLVAIIFVAICMGIGGVLGVMNTMFAAISQRSKDIGVLRIIGFAPWQILVSFFLETLLLAVAGGLLGCALGYLSDGWTASSIVSQGQGGGKSVVLKLIVDGQILMAGLLFSLGMGFVGGLLPSLGAMRTRPLDAVR
jgi:ABC-type lipoprotein release transport system permease subunit